MQPWILGVSYSHNGAACLLKGEQVHVAIQEERLSGKKRARIRHHLESLAVRYCLEHAGLTLSDLDALVICHFSRATPPPLTLPDRPAPPPKQYLTIPHHLGHAFGAHGCSGLSEAVALVIDGQGGPLEHLPANETTALRRGAVPNRVRESEVASIYQPSSDGLTLVEKHTGDWLPAYRQLGPVPRSLLQFGSLGGMYAATSALIFDDAMEAGKVMGLAPYGRPRFQIKEFFEIDAQGCFHFSERLPNQLRDLAPWPQNQELFRDLAASAQQALEHGVLFLAERARELTGRNTLCYSGGVALNSVANERIFAELGFDDVYIMPAAEDSGTAIGAAYFGLYALTGHAQGPRLEPDAAGRAYNQAECEEACAKVPFIRVESFGEKDAGGEKDAARDIIADVIDEAVNRLCAGELLGWFQDGSEFGPRALGRRSIICDPRLANGKAKLNARVKHREPFRPFAPAILLDEATSWFELPSKFPSSPHMLRVAPFLSAKRVPVVEHVDNTGRLQTLTPGNNGMFFALVQRFHDRTGVPLLTNTSFNIAGEPIVETPEDALWCLLSANLDALVLGELIVTREASFHSLLQMMPKLCADSAQLAVPIHDGALQLTSPTTVWLRTDTPHGVVIHQLAPKDLPLLRLCDGTRTGEEILEILSRDSDHEPDQAGEEQLMLVLARLRRKRLLTFEMTETPSTRPATS